MTLRLAAIVLRDTARPIGGRLAPVNLAILFALVQFWTQIPWELVRAWLAADVARATALGVGLLAVWQAVWGPTLAALVKRPTLAPFWRTGLGTWTRGVAIAPVFAMSAAPILAMTGLWPGPGYFLAHLGAAIVFGALAMTRVGTIAILPAALGLTLIEVYTPEWLVLLPAPWLAGSIHRWSTLPGSPRVPGKPRANPGSRRGAPDGVGGESRISGFGRRVFAGEWGENGPLARPARTFTLPAPRGPVTALLYRDALTLVRTAPDVLRGALVAAVPTAVLVYGFRRNGANADLLALAAAVLACVCAPLGGMALERLRTNLGNAWFVRRWPPGATVRVFTLLLVALGTFAPSGVAMAAALASPALPPLVGPVLPMVLAATACAAGAVVAARRTRFEWGWNLWWIFGVLLLVLWDSGWGRLGQAVATFGALVLARRGLERG